jgi:hypothetical protein
MSVSTRCRTLFRSVLRGIFVPRSRELIWLFLEKVIVVPQIAGSRAGGPLDTGRMPQWRGMLELYDNPRVHFFTMAKAARIGGTLFFGICIVINKILRRPGPIGWLDPTGKTAKSVSRREVEPYFHACPQLMALAIVSKTTWTTLEKIFVNCIFTMLGSGSINDLGGRQFEEAVINEQDRIRGWVEGEPTPSNEMEVRTSQYSRTRKIVRNCTPFGEGKLTWTEFLAGSQHHSYQPCPECRGYQRLTFFREPAEPDRWMRVEANDPILTEQPLLINHQEDRRNSGVLRPADSQRREDPREIKPCKSGRGILVKGIPQTGRVVWPESFRDKRNGRWNIDGAARAARYECAFCQAHWTPDQLTATHVQYQLRAHNIHAVEENASGTLHTLHSPWHPLEIIVRQWLLAEGSIGKVRDFFCLWLGMPAPCPPTKITPKHIELIQSKSPRYERQFPELADSELLLPARPVVMTMHSDVNQDGCRYSIRALLEDGSRYLLAWGIAGGFTELDRIAERVWIYDHGEQCHPELRFEQFSPYTQIAGNPLATCVIDTGWKAKNALGVYQFIHDMGGKWMGVRGGKFAGLGNERPIAEETFTFNYPNRGQVDIPVIQQNDFTLTEHFSRFVLKERRGPEYYLPTVLDDVFVTELCAPYLQKVRLSDGRTEDKWHFECDPHFYDAEKYGEVLCFIFAPEILAQLRKRQDDHRERLLARLQRV